MKNNTNKNNISSKSNQSTKQTSSKNNQMTNKTNQMKTVPDQRERRDGPGGE